MEPCEVSLAHHGVLVLDERPGCRPGPGHPGRGDEPLSVREQGHPTKPCPCTPLEVKKYLGRISGSLFDRIDLHVEMPAVPYRELATAAPGETSASTRARVAAARARQQARFRGKRLYSKAQPRPEDVAETFQYRQLDRKPQWAVVENWTAG